MSPPPARSSRSLRAAEQYLWRRSGGSVRVAQIGRLHYNVNPSPQHSHLQPFEVYELRTLDGQRLVRDHKNGFCGAPDRRSKGATVLAVVAAGMAGEERRRPRRGTLTQFSAVRSSAGT